MKQQRASPIGDGRRPLQPHLFLCTRCGETLSSPSRHYTCPKFDSPNTPPPEVRNAQR